MRILNVMDLPRLPASGMPIALANLVSQQIAQGHQVSALLYSRNALIDDAQSAYLNFLDCPTVVARGLQEFIRVVRLSKNTVECIHIHGLWSVSSLSGLLLANDCKARIRQSLHGTLDQAALKFGRLKKAMFWYGLQKYALDRVDEILVTSENERIGAQKMLPHRTLMLEPLVLPDIRPVALPKSGPKKILYFGRLHPIKGLTRLLEAWARIQQKMPGWQLHLTGPDDAEWGQFYRRLAVDLKLERTFFNDAVPAHMRLSALAEAHLVVAPSLTENFGLTIGEALALGRCVVASTETGWQPQIGLFLSTETEDLGESILKAADYVLSQLNC